VPFSYGFREKTSISFSSGEVMKPIPQTPEDLAIGRKYLRAGCQKIINEEVTTGEAKRIRSTNAMMSSQLCDIERRTGEMEGVLCRKPVESIHALAQRKQDCYALLRMRPLLNS
jgi:hypothetical protein